MEGHCDERGTVEYNLALGERRARAAYDYLVSLGVPADRLKTVSYGKEVPVCTESTEDCWARNRRARFTVTGKTAGRARTGLSQASGARRRRSLGAPHLTLPLCLLMPASGEDLLIRRAHERAVPTPAERPPSRR